MCSGLATPGAVRFAGAVAVLQIGEVQVELRRSSKRRTLGLQVRDGRATAHAPLGMPEAQIRTFLERKRHWLHKHVQAQQATAALPPVKLGDPWPFLGETLTLQADAAAKKAYRAGHTLHLPPTRWQTHLQAWVSREVQPTYAALVREYAAQLGAAQKLGQVRVSQTRSRWGSCSASGDIRLHWALSRAPLSVLHYVALHEAAHLLEMNHSPRYWANVARLMPDHATQRLWLRQHGRGLLVLGEG